MTRRAKHAYRTRAASPSRPSRPHAFTSSRLVIQPGMTGSLIDRTTRPLDARGGQLRRPPRPARRRPGAGLPRRAPSGHNSVARRKGLGRLRRRPGPGTPRPRTHARALRRHHGVVETGDQEGADGPAEDRRRRQHLRERGALRGGHRPVQAGVTTHAPRLTTSARPHPPHPARPRSHSQGTTFRDYRTGTGEKGNFQLELFVYGREGEKCRVCGTRLAHTHEIDARITVFCHKCQQ